MVRLTVELLEDCNRSEYEDFISGTEAALFQHSWSWRTIIEHEGQDDPRYLGARDAEGNLVAALPAFVFRHELGSLLISIPQAGGYGGIVYKPEHREAAFDALIPAFTSLAQDEECVLATVCTPPFSPDTELYKSCFRPDYTRENFYQYIDLAGDWMASLSSKQRNNIKRNLRIARESGLTAEFSLEAGLLDSWYHVHIKRMTELGARPLPKSLFECAREMASKDSRIQFGYVMDGERVVSGAMFIRSQTVMDIFMMSGDSAEIHRQPNTLLVYEALETLKGTGIKQFNWQSSSSRTSGVYNFKKEWGSKESTHFYMTRAVDDVSTIIRSSPEQLSREFAWHFVLPYDALVS